jgi:flagellar protein FliO/FliZ
VIELVLRIGFSLLVVLGLMWGIARIARRPLARRGGDLLSVLARQQLTRGSSVAVLRVADRAFVLGVTDHQVTLLSEADLAVVGRPEPAGRRRAVRLRGEDPTRPPDGLPWVAPPESGSLAGSVVSRRTWTQAMEFLRDRTVRKP